MTNTGSAETVGRKTKRWNRPKPRSLPPALRFTPYAWAKLLFLRDVGETEVGGFGISSPTDLLLIEDVRLVGQKSTIVSVEFDDNAVADFFDAQVDIGLPPERFFRLWLHTHPGDSARPSATDEETFHRVFARCDWAIMAILAQEGDTYARLRFSAGPGGQYELPVRIDYGAPFPAADPDAWETEYKQCVLSLDDWYQPVLIPGDSWDWPMEYQPADFEFQELGRLDEYDENGSLLPAGGPGPTCEAG